MSEPVDPRAEETTPSPDVVDEKGTEIEMAEDVVPVVDAPADDDFVVVPAETNLNQDGTPPVAPDAPVEAVDEPPTLDTSEEMVWNADHQCYLPKHRVPEDPPAPPEGKRWDVNSQQWI